MKFWGNCRENGIINAVRRKNMLKCALFAAVVFSLMLTAYKNVDFVFCWLS